MQFTLENPVTNEKPIDIALASLFGNPPKTVMNDTAVAERIQQSWNIHRTR